MSRLRRWNVGYKLTLEGEGDRKEPVLTLRQFLIALACFGVTLLIAGCKRGEPVKTLLLHDSPGARARRFDDVKVLKKQADYVKFRTASGEVIEFSGRYEIKQ